MESRNTRYRTFPGYSTESTASQAERESGFRHWLQGVNSRDARITNQFILIRFWVMTAIAAVFVLLLSCLAIKADEIDDGPITPTALSDSRKWLSVDITTHHDNIVGHGSGTIIGTNQGIARILTAKHLFSRGEKTAEIRDYGGVMHTGNVVAISASSDLAVIETEMPSGVKDRLSSRGLDPAGRFQIRTDQTAPAQIQIAGYGQGVHKLIGQSGRRVSGPVQLKGRHGTYDDCYVYAVNPREGDSGGGAFSATGFVGVVTHQSSDTPHRGIIAGPESVREFVETQCIGGWCPSGLSIDSPGLSLRAGRFVGNVGYSGGQVFERYRRGPFNWESYTRRGPAGFNGGFATTYGGVWGGGRGSFASYAMESPIIDTVISPAYAPVYAPQVIEYPVRTIAPSVQIVPTSQLPPQTGDLGGRLGVVRVPIYLELSVGVGQ
jgi:hypothetical protein